MSLRRNCCLLITVVFSFLFPLAFIFWMGGGDEFLKTFTFKSPPNAFQVESQINSQILEFDEITAIDNVKVYENSQGRFLVHSTASVSLNQNTRETAEKIRNIARNTLFEQYGSYPYLEVKIILIEPEKMGREWEWNSESDEWQQSIAKIVDIQKWAQWAGILILVSFGVVVFINVRNIVEKLIKRL